MEVDGKVAPEILNQIKEEKAIHPGKLTWNIIMEVWKIIFLSKWVISRFHVNLPGCTLSSQNLFQIFQVFKDPDVSGNLVFSRYR